MRIQKIWFDEIPNRVTGNIVMIDAYAASSNISILLSKHPKRLIIVNESTLQKARNTYQSSMLVGESYILPLTDFVFTNQLKDMYEGDVSGRNVLWMSNNGSRVFEKAIKCVENGEVLAGSFNNLSTLSKYLLTKNKPVTIIMSGDSGNKVLEDRLCAQTIEKKLLGVPIDWDSVKIELRDFISEYYAHDAFWNLPFLLGHIDDLAIVPDCFVNKKGFLEVVQTF